MKPATATSPDKMFRMDNRSDLPLVHGRYLEYSIIFCDVHCEVFHALISSRCRKSPQSPPGAFLMPALFAIPMARNEHSQDKCLTHTPTCEISTVTVIRISAYKKLQGFETKLLIPSHQPGQSHLKMEATWGIEKTTSKRKSGQRTTESSPARTDSSIDSAPNPVIESSPDQSPFQCGFDTPQSSVVDIILRPGAAQQQRRVARFVECFCVSGGPCAGSGGQATCNCGASPEVAEAPRSAEKRSIKKFAKGIARNLKRAWKKSIRAIKNKATRALRKGLDEGGGVDL